MMGASFSFFTAGEAVKATDWSGAKPTVRSSWYLVTSLADVQVWPPFHDDHDLENTLKLVALLPIRWQLYLDKKTKFGPERKLFWDG